MAGEGSISPRMLQAAVGCLECRTRYGQTFGCLDFLVATVGLSPPPHAEILCVCGGGGGGRVCV